MSAELNQQMKKNLATFLSRVDIKGYEAEAMVELKIFFGLSPLKMIPKPQDIQQKDELQSAEIKNLSLLRNKKSEEKQKNVDKTNTV